MNSVVTVVCSIVTVLLALYYATTKKFNYWKKKKVPYEKPWPLFGNYAEYILQRKFTSEISQALCRRFSNEPYFGTFFGTEPALIVQDPDVIKLILQKDFYYFNSRELMDYTDREVTTQNILFLSGDQWKVLRSGLTPLFSPAKIKSMFYLVKNCAYSFEDMLHYEYKMSPIFDAKALMTRYTIDSICSCGFGIDVKTMDKKSHGNPFLTIGEIIFNESIVRGLHIVSRAMCPAIFYGLGMKTYPKEINQFFHKILTGVFESRNYEPSQKHDFVDLVLSLKKHHYIIGGSITNLKTGGSEKVQIEVTDDLLVSQCIMFFGAGFETSANALSHTIFELAKNQEAQKRAQEEVDEFLRQHDNKLVYECVTDLPYVYACVCEAFRLYPALAIFVREVVEDYTFPSGLRLERGVRVHLPVYHLHRNPEHFPDPELFQPERFLPGAEHPIKPYTYLPFGEGPRACKQLAKMQLIAALVTFLKKYQVTLAEGTPTRFRHQTTTIMLQSASELLLRVSLRDGWEERAYKL